MVKQKLFEIRNIDQGRSLAIQKSMHRLILVLLRKQDKQDLSWFLRLHLLSL